MRLSNFHSTATLTEGNNTLNFTYGPNQQRKKTELLQQGILTKTTYFLPAYEEITQGNDTYKVHYVGSQAICVQHNNNQGELFYTYTDHLGSLLTLTDNTGNTIFEQNGVYPECNRRNAWGNHRNPQTWTSAPFTGSGLPWLIRGFTGHEHLPEFALINMNGRTYDPLLGRMLSVDNFVQDATSTQGYNRYSYVRNNPLKFVDPDGEYIQIVVGAIVGGTVNFIQNGAHFNKDGLVAFGVGAAAGALAAALGPAGGLGAEGAGVFASQATANLVAGAAGGALNIGAELAFTDQLKGANFAGFVGSFGEGFNAGVAGGTAAARFDAIGDLKTAAKDKRFLKSISKSERFQSIKVANTQIKRSLLKLATGNIGKNAISTSTIFGIENIIRNAKENNNFSISDAFFSFSLAALVLPPLFNKVSNQIFDPRNLILFPVNSHIKNQPIPSFKDVLKSVTIIPF